MVSMHDQRRRKMGRQSRPLQCRNTARKKDVLKRDLILILPLCRSVNLMKWNCHIPGKANTDWDGGYFPLTMEFSEDYPAKPPKV